MLQNHPSHATVELPFQKFMSQDPSNTTALEYHEPPNLPLLRLFSVYHNRNQSSRYPHGLRPSRKTSIIQSLLGKVRSWVTNSFQSLDHCDLRIKTQEPVEDEDCCALANHGGEEEANTLDLRGFSDLLLLEARTGSSCHSLNS